ncbi:MAG TPA: hypothetical protein VLG15_07535 [Thermoanaerobaculia bacterium]|nr:hypothetical protein [Thermoanaerobaculia bacterium]
MPGGRQALTLLEALAWAVFFGAGVILWASGILLFAKSRLSPTKKIVWTLLLVAVGAAIGALLPLDAIRNRFLILLAALPLLAFVDVRIARSNRNFSFWFRACAFEVCTVFGSAAITRALLRAI